MTSESSRSLLLDTQILLWWLNGDSALSEKTKKLIADPERAVYYSAAAVWEIRIKESLQKLVLPTTFQSALEEEDMMELPVKASHAHAVKNLPPLHKHPFDRILVAQAITENLTLLTADAALAHYNERVLVV